MTIGQTRIDQQNARPRCCGRSTRDCDQAQNDEQMVAIGRPRDIAHFLDFAVCRGSGCGDVSWRGKRDDCCRCGTVGCPDHHFAQTLALRGIRVQRLSVGHTITIRRNDDDRSARISSRRKRAQGSARWVEHPGFVDHAITCLARKSHRECHTAIVEKRRAVDTCARVSRLELYRVWTSLEHGHVHAHVAGDIQLTPIVHRGRMCQRQHMPPFRHFHGKRCLSPLMPVNQHCRAGWRAGDVQMEVSRTIRRRTQAYR